MGVEKDHIKKAFGSVLHDLRTEKKITHVELEDLSGITRKHIYNLEKGLNDPTLSNIFKLANAMGVKPTQLIKKVESDVLREQ